MNIIFFGVKIIFSTKAVASIIQEVYLSCVDKGKFILCPNSLDTNYIDKMSYTSKANVHLCILAPPPPSDVWAKMFLCLLTDIPVYHH